MKFFHLSATITATAFYLMPGFHSSAIASEPDYLCFFTSSSGKVIDLTKSFCAAAKPKVEDGDNKDKAFIEAYKQQVSAYPEVRDNLLASMEQSPQTNIEQAKSVCNQLKAGLSFEDIQKTQTEEDSEPANIVNANIIDDLAIKYYCPEMSN